MNYIFSPSEKFEFQCNNNYTKKLIQKFASEVPIEDILVYIYINFNILYKEEKNLTLWESVEFYRNYLNYRKSLKDPMEKELYFNFTDKKFSRKAFYINIVTRINYFIKNQKFLYIGNDFTSGLDLEKKVYYKFNFDEKINMIVLKRVYVIWDNQPILIPHQNQINTKKINDFQKWSKENYNKQEFKNYKQKENGIYYIKVLVGIIALFILFLIFYWKGM